MLCEQPQHYVDSMVVEILEKKQYVNDSNIKDVTIIHCIKYTKVDDKLKYHVCWYYGIEM